MQLQLIKIVLLLYLRMQKQLSVVILHQFNDQEGALGKKLNYLITLGIKERACHTNLSPYINGECYLSASVSCVHTSNLIGRDNILAQLDRNLYRRTPDPLLA